MARVPRRLLSLFGGAAALLASAASAQNLAVPDAFPEHVEAFVSIPSMGSFEEPLSGTRLATQLGELLTAWNECHEQPPSLLMAGLAHYWRQTAIRLNVANGSPAASPIRGVDAYLLARDGEGFDRSIVIAMSNEAAATALGARVRLGAMAANTTDAWTTETVRTANGDPVEMSTLGTTTFAVMGPVFVSGTSQDAVRTAIMGGGGRRMLEHRALRSTWPLLPAGEFDALAFATPKAMTALGLADVEGLGVRGIDVTGFAATTDVRHGTFAFDSVVGFERMPSGLAEHLRRRTHGRQPPLNLMFEAGVFAYAGDFLEPEVNDAMLLSGPQNPLARALATEGAPLLEAYGPSFGFNIWRLGWEEQDGPQVDASVAMEIRSESHALEFEESLEAAVTQMIANLTAASAGSELNVEPATFEVQGMRVRSVAAPILNRMGSTGIFHARWNGLAVFAHEKPGILSALKLVRGQRPHVHDLSAWGITEAADVERTDAVWKLDLVRLAAFPRSNLLPIAGYAGLGPECGPLFEAVLKTMRALGTARGTARLTPEGRWTRLTVEFGEEE